MISDISNTTLIVAVGIDAFFINDNIKNSKDAYKSEQKDHNLAVE